MKKYVVFNFIVGKIYLYMALICRHRSYAAQQTLCTTSESELQIHNVCSHKHICPSFTPTSFHKVCNYSYQHVCNILMKHTTCQVPTNTVPSVLPTRIKQCWSQIKCSMQIPPPLHTTCLHPSVLYVDSITNLTFSYEYSINIQLHGSEPCSVSMSRISQHQL